MSAFAALEGRLVWEQTLLSWREGPQMVGFTVFHQAMPLVLLVLAVFSVVVLKVVSTFALSLFRRQRPGASTTLAGVVVLVQTVVFLMPTQGWQLLFAEKFARSAWADDFVCQAATNGHERLVRAFIAHGVIISPGKPALGTTVLHCAVASDQPQMIDYLLTVAPELLDQPDYRGNSPLDVAVMNNDDLAAAALTRHGAKRIHRD